MHLSRLLLPCPRFVLACLVALAAGAAPMAASQRALELEPVATGFQLPLQVLSAPGDHERLFVVEQGGLVHIVRDGVIEPRPFLNISGGTTAFIEQGLLGMAFHPDYDQNGWVFVHYTNLNGHTRLDRFTVDANDPDKVDPSTRVKILQVQQPDFNHNGGTIAFGPDGYLYLGLGDGGGAGDPGNRAQDGSTLLGKILRLDVSVAPYRIPPSNPFVGNPTVEDEIWAIGMRNPWRFSFDQETGDLWIGDVGEASWEEVNFEPAGSGGGLNYGWRIMEGPDCHNPSTGCNQTGLTLPLYSMAYGGTPFRCSVIGGFVYRGEEMATMQGRYFFGDYCSGEVFSMRRDANGQVVDFVNHEAELGPIGQISSFGEDAAGELYVVSRNGSVYKLVPAGMRLQVSQTSAGQTAEFSISGAAPLKRCILGYTAVGLKRTFIPGLGLYSDLRRPKMAIYRPADAAGNWVATYDVPPGGAGYRFWVQATSDGMVSNVVTFLVD